MGAASSRFRFRSRPVWEFILVAAIVGVPPLCAALGGVLNPPVSFSGCPGVESIGGATSIGPGPAPAFGSPIPSTIAWRHWYNVSVESAGSGALIWGDFRVAILVPGGESISPARNWTLGVLDGAGSIVGEADLGSGSWEIGTTIQVMAGQSVDLYSANEGLGGDNELFADIQCDGYTTTLGIP